MTHRWAMGCLVLVSMTFFFIAMTAGAIEAGDTEGSKIRIPMMLEHVDMDCATCHGEGGPKKMMMEHKGIKCSVCHGAETQPAKSAPMAEGKRIPLKDKMMLEHVGMDCATCHGKDGPKGMMMEHHGISCATCHMVGGK